MGWAELIYGEWRLLGLGQLYKQNWDYPGVRTLDDGIDIRRHVYESVQEGDGGKRRAALYELEMRWQRERERGAPER